MEEDTSDDLVGTSAASPEPTPQADIWDALRQRPLSLPLLRPGDPCPVTPLTQVIPGFFPLPGDGPLYPVQSEIVTYRHADDESREWGGQKIAWVSSPEYKGPALIRGHQLDGPSELRFGHGVDPPAELEFSDAYLANSVAPGWRTRPALTRVRAPGCYAYQVDGLGFSQVIVFEARPE